MISSARRNSGLLELDENNPSMSSVSSKLTESESMARKTRLGLAGEVRPERAMASRSRDSVCK